MPILAGIDEAGVGPRLGPLVAAAVTFRGPAELAGGSLWELLRPAVSTSGRGLVIADSKALYGGQRDQAGFRRLEHGVLAALGTARGVPDSLAELMEDVAGASAGEVERLPWYQLGAVPLPRAADRAGIQRDSRRLAERLRELEMDAPQVACELVGERDFNRLVAGAGGKGEALLQVDGRLLRRLPAGGGQVYLDRLGGRRRYGRWLQDVFPQAFVWTGSEDAATSRYRVVGQDGTSLEVAVAVGCESRQLPVALASMVAKYIRELHMELLNRYWAARVPGLAPTAGYPADAARFLREIGAAAHAEGLTTSDLVRCR